MRKRPLIAVSGGFDPVHIGHIRMIRDAARYGDVLVIINSDAWLERKKGYVFMPWKERAEIMGNIKGVRLVTQVDDSDGTVCEALTRHKPDVFANGAAVVRVGDTTGCGDPATGGSSTVKANGISVHRKGDGTGGHGSWVPNASSSGSSNVFAGG